MKLFKKLMSYFIALTMVLSLATLLRGNVHAVEGTTGTQGATTGYKLTLKGTTKDHTYEAYQVFKGDLSTDTDGKKVLSNVQWGTGVSWTGTETAAEIAEKLSNKTMSPEDLTNELSGKNPKLSLTTTKKTKKSSEDSNETVIDGLAAGYYLVKDADNSQNGRPDAYTKFIVDVVGDTVASIKSDVPTVEKKVQDTNDSEANSTTDWQDSADYDIGDEIPYKLTGTLPTNYDNYNSYYYKFTDTMTNLTYNEGTLEVKANGSKVDSDKYTAHFDPATKTLTVEFLNLKNVIAKYSADAKVTVEYSATLDQGANTGSTGNPNTVNLTYSNNPNNSGNGETGKTPDDKNIVFTYKVVVNKIDENKNALAGAVFTLSKVKADNTTDTVKTFTLTGNKEEDPTTFTATGLDDGTYVLKETKTPTGYNTIKDQYFTITAEHDELSDNPTLKSLSGNKVTGNAQTTIEFTADKDAGSLTTNVVNKKGSELPSTGGMGTTLLYAVGGVLVALAAAYIIISKKHEKAE